MSLKGVPMNIFTISKWRPFFKMAATSNIILGIFRQIFFSEPIILCNSTFLGFLRSRKPNLTFSNSKWPPFFQNGGHFSKMATIFLSNSKYFSLSATRLFREYDVYHFVLYITVYLMSWGFRNCL